MSIIINLGTFLFICLACMFLGWIACWIDNVKKKE